MDIDKIEILLRAIELGSLSKAAYEFSYTPSAVSHILDSIESEIGIKFIVRTHTGIEIKCGTEDIICNLRKIVSTQNALKRIAKDLHNKKNILTVATYASLSKDIMAKIIKGFNRENSDIHINIVVVNDIRMAFEEATADVMIGERIDADGICWEKLLVDPYVAIFSENDAYSQHVIKREELYDYPFVKARHGKIASYIDDSRFSNVISVDSHDDSSVIHMVREGLGTAILPLLSVYGETGVTYKKLQPEFDRTLGLIYCESDFNNKNELKRFIEYVRGFDFGKFSKDKYNNF